jgi:hypothetical protein
LVVERRELGQSGIRVSEVVAGLDERAITELRGISTSPT